jgi:hypothetical protein
MNTPGIVVRTWNDAPITRRDSDGYADATAMCQANGKRWFDYERLDRTTDYIQALATATGLSPDQLVLSVKGGPAHLQGTWIHPRLAVDLARWISPAFAVWMDGWFLEAAAGAGAPTRKPRQAPLPPFRMEDLEVILSNGEPVTTTAVLPLLGLPNTRANQMALAAVLRQLGYTKLRVRRTGRRLEWVFFPPGWQSCARPALPPAAPCIVIQASSYREAAQAWAEALEGAAVGAIRRRFSTVSRPGNLLPAGVHFLPLQA